ncbi:MAG: succinylglutamate desuccinylase/aspartoacylase family protein [Myxococcota bacterium]
MSLDAQLAPWEATGRILGIRDGGLPGPTVVVTGGMHGNEPAGLVAGRRVLDRLADHGNALRGRLVVIAGNMAALEAERRFLDRDLNRRWDRESLEQLRRRAATPHHPEDVEQLELLRIFERVVEHAGRRGAIHLDLHSTSGDARPFAVVVDVAHNLALARAIRLPIILGFDRFVEAPVLDWWHARSLPALGVEGGRHDAPDTPGRLEAVVWWAMVGAGMLEADEVPQEVDDPEDSVATAPGEPWCFHILHRHGVEPGDGFRMAPGWEGFQPVRRGDVLARDRAGTIRAPCDGLMFLPLYQEQGSDGFFLIEPVKL